jgi:fibronectin type 3 domain-containing protein
MSMESLKRILSMSLVFAIAMLMLMPCGAVANGVPGPGAPASAAPSAAAPSAPRDLQGTGGMRMAVLNWTAPLSDGGAPLTAYRVYRSLFLEAEYGLVASVPPSYRSYVDDGLTEGVTYYYCVSAVNSVGEGPWTTPVPATPSGATPSGSFASIQTSGMQVTVTFGAFSAPVAITDLRFVIEDLTAGASETWSASTATDPVQLTNASSSPYPMPQLNSVVFRDIADNGRINLGDYLLLTYSNSAPVDHTYRVTMIYIATGDAINMINFIGPSSSVSQPPGPVQNLTAAAGNAQATLTWQAPSSDGGSPVTGYRAYRALSSGGEYVEIAFQTALSLTDSGLTNGETYYYKVAAVNAVGEGQRSSAASATPATVPSAPWNAAASAVVGKVTLTWQAPNSTGGRPIARYDIYRGSTPETIGSTPIGNVSLFTQVYNDTTVAPSTTYCYLVKAVNGIGSSASSNIVAITSVAVPGAPQNLTATPGPAKITLTWQAPLVDDGSAITGWKLYAVQNGTPVLIATLGAAPLSYVHNNPPNVVNVFYVTAINAVGEGAASNQASAQPQPANTDNSTMLILGGVLVAIVVVLLAFLLMRGKK